MSEEVPNLKSRSARDLLRLVLRHEPCWVCKADAPFMVGFRERVTDGATFTSHYAMCRLHWDEARNHPHYFSAEEL